MHHTTQARIELHLLSSWLRFSVNSFYRKEREILGVEAKIDHCECYIQNSPPPNDNESLRALPFEYWIEEKKQLREEKKQLREKEKQLREEKNKLREKDNILLAQGWYQLIVEIMSSEIVHVHIA